MSDPEASGDGTADPAGLVVASASGSVGIVRQYAVNACLRLGWGDCADTVALLVSEVATNAVLHAYGAEIRVRVLESGVRLRVEVVDDSPVMPTGRRAPADAEDGRGIALVDALAVRWDTDGQQDGKTVWFEIAR